MTLSFYSDEISFSPLKKEFQGYSWTTLQSDAAAAVSVALLTVPQAIAYAVLAGLPYSCGLIAAIYSAIIAAFFGSSRHLVVGPSNAIAILTQAGTAEILFTYYRDLSGAERDLAAVQILTQVAFLTGFLQVLAASCKLGRLTQFVSYSVIIGYIVGTAFAVLINQSYALLGIPRFIGVHSLYERGVYLLSHLNQAHLPTALVGISSLFLLIGIKRINRKIPAGVIVLAFASTIVYLISLFPESMLYGFLQPNTQEIQGVRLIGDSGEISEVIPHFALPFFNARIMNAALPMSFALALLSIMETTSVAKSIASSSGQRLSINQEIFGIGMGNLVSAFTGAMPVSGSPSRSAMNVNSGAQTRFAAILNAVFVACLLYCFGFLVTRIPLTALAALLLFSVVNTVNVKQLLVCLKATSSDAFVLWVTLFACIFFSFDIAFYIGVVLSIILYLKKAAAPQLVEYELTESGELQQIDFQSQLSSKKIRMIKVEGELFFGAADLFQSALKAIAEDDTKMRVLILQLKNARDIDATACLALQHLHVYLTGSKRYLLACGITQPVWEALSDSGLVEQIGKENLFIFDERHPQEYLKKAWRRAHLLAKEEEEAAPVLSPLVISSAPEASISS